MVYDCLYTIENTSYLFDTDGTLMTADGVKYDFVSWKKKIICRRSQWYYCQTKHRQN